MRLIDVGVLKNLMIDQFIEAELKVPDNLAEGFVQMENLINEQPTAYDLEAVVQQLEELLEELSDCGDDWYTSEKLNQAIEIVRNGGVK